jgi:hypothetical protein
MLGWANRRDEGPQKSSSPLKWVGVAGALVVGVLLAFAFAIALENRTDEGWQKSFRMKFILCGILPRYLVSRVE